MWWRKFGWRTQCGWGSLATWSATSRGDARLFTQSSLQLSSANRNRHIVLVNQLSRLECQLILVLRWLAGCSNSVLLVPVGLVTPYLVLACYL